MEVVKRMHSAHWKNSKSFCKNGKALEEQQDKFSSKDAAVWVDNFIDSLLQRRAVVTYNYAIETTGCCSPETANKHIRCLLERHGNKRWGQDENWTRKHREHRKNTAQVQASDTDGPPAFSWRGTHNIIVGTRQCSLEFCTVLGGSVFQEGTRPAKNRLEWCSQQPSYKNGVQYVRADAGWIKV